MTALTRTAVDEWTGQPDPDTDRCPTALVASDRIAAAVEAVLLVTDVPLPAAVIAEALEVDGADVCAALLALQQEYDDAGRGFGLVAVAGGWRLATRPEFARVVERHLREGQQVRLTQAALEALVVVAYQEPVTRALVSSVRGVASDGVLRTLVARGMVEECGSDDAGALRYRTTSTFLEKLGLDSLAELPPLAPHLPDLPDIAELTEPDSRREPDGRVRFDVPFELEGAPGGDGRADPLPTRPAVGPVLVETT